MFSTDTGDSRVCLYITSHEFIVVLSAHQIQVLTNFQLVKSVDVELLDTED